MAVIDQAARDIRGHRRYVEPEKSLSNPPSEETIRQWTDALTDFTPRSTVSPEVEATLEEIRRTYSENEKTLERYAVRLDVQPISHSSPKEILFTAYVRTLQSDHAGEANLTPDIFNELMEENYSIEGSDSEIPETEHTDRRDSGTSETFQPGETYHRLDDIHARFGGNRYRRIAPSADHPYVFLFFGKSDEWDEYDDELREDGTLLYTGEGREGDMEMAGGNTAVRDHTEAGDELHVFEIEEEAWQVAYVGQYQYTDHQQIPLPDRNDEIREAIRFELVPVG